MIRIGSNSGNIVQNFVGTELSYEITRPYKIWEDSVKYYVYRIPAVSLQKQDYM